MRDIKGMSIQQDDAAYERQLAGYKIAKAKVDKKGRHVIRRSRKS